ncbi:MAG TPA: CHAT domain-containing protein, partial [Pirellulales bacterium]|nr:CHAT domain-containing protein [Pirellulales bacterium]
RIAVDLFQKVLREPTAADWAFDPLESLSTLVAPHVPMLEHWFELTLKMSKEHERALEISDRIRKHRFLLTQEWGGRLLNLRWVLEGPEELIGPDAVIQRQALLARFPAYEALSKQARQLRNELGEMPLVADDLAVAQRQKEKLAALALVGVNQEKMLRAIGLRREPCELVFPPLRTTRQVQELLPDRTAILAFFSTSSAKYAFLLTNDRSKYRNWEVKLPKNFPRQVVTLLQSWGNFQPNADLHADVLAKSDWKQRGRAMLELLTREAKVNLAGQFDELVIVPDGILWYVPFEALQFSDGDATRPLVARLRMRYVPTVGLGVGNTRPRVQNGNTAVVVGKLYPNDAPEVAEAEFEKLARVVTDAHAIKGPLPGPSPVFASLVDRLIVLDDVAPVPNGGPYDWAPLQTERQGQAGALSNWFAFPWGGPDQVILPGFHTPAERGLREPPSTIGDDLFLSICGLMSTGARTVLISRWRPAGQMSYNLVREFVQELPHSSAAESWQRSVLLAENAEIDPGAEPRVKLKSNEAPPKAANPFFWAGYLLADTGSSPHETPPSMEYSAALDDDADKLPAVRRAAAAANGAVKAPQAKGRAKAEKGGGTPAAKPAAMNGAAPALAPEMDDDPDALELKPRKPGRKAEGADDDTAMPDNPAMDDASAPPPPGKARPRAAVPVAGDEVPLPPRQGKAKKAKPPKM